MPVASTSMPVGASVGTIREPALFTMVKIKKKPTRWLSRRKPLGGSHTPFRYLRKVPSWVQYFKKGGAFRKAFLKFKWKQTPRKKASRQSRAMYGPFYNAAGVRFG